MGGVWDRLKPRHVRIREQLARAGADVPLGEQPERRHVAIVCVRLSGFERFAESLDPERISEALRELVVAGEVAAEAGRGWVAVEGPRLTLNFGLIPRLQEPEKAALLAAAVLFDVRWRERMRRIDPELGLAVGVASGECLYGEFGSETRAFSGCVGGAADRAFRLGAMARAGEVLVDEATVRVLGVEVRAELSRVELPEGGSYYRWQS